ncbi:hypothetical protein GQ53DRAFT_351189 [Thozetella sp. PMI_491]|nr:hypothetical protein GQ53DRAFT_351189 [Thozetella sp. PMI_491]
MSSKVIEAARSAFNPDPWPGPPGSLPPCNPQPSSAGAEIPNPSRPARRRPLVATFGHWWHRQVGIGDRPHPRHPSPASTTSLFWRQFQPGATSNLPQRLNASTTLPHALDFSIYGPPSLHPAPATRTARASPGEASLQEGSKKTGVSPVRGA